MITITRNLARQVRSVFRRALNITPRGASHPLTFQAGPDGLSIRAKAWDSAAEYRAPGQYAAETLTLPFEFLADCEGKKDHPVELSAGGDGRVAVQWRDGAVPQIVQYDAPTAPEPADFPQLPGEMADNPVSLLAALHEACETTDPAPTRLAIDHVQLRGRAGRLAATDGRQLLVQNGFHFPWEGDVLVPRSRIFAAPELAESATLRVGKSEKWLTLAAGPWTIHLGVNSEGSFPEVERQVADAASVTSRFRLSDADAQFLAATLPNLPSEDEFLHPATIDLNGRIILRARSAGQPPTEVSLPGSTCSGKAVRLNTNRNYLARAIRLGFREVEVVGAKSPVTCRDADRAYVWALLEPEAAIGPHKDAVRIESPAPEGQVPVPQPIKKRRQHTVSQSAATPSSKPNGAAASNGDAKTASPTPASRRARTNGQARRGSSRKGGQQDLSSLIQQAEALRESLRDTLGKAKGLLRGLKQHRRQDRAIQSTIASLRQLKTLGV